MHSGDHIERSMSKEWESAEALAYLRTIHTLEFSDLAFFVNRADWRVIKTFSNRGRRYNVNLHIKKIYIWNMINARC